MTRFHDVAHLLGVVFIEEQNRMHISIPRVKNVGDGQSELVADLHDFFENFRQF